jgi:nucleoside-diphosphate-sugar epimerase
MKILVTGATGCLGSAVANQLHSQGFTVTGTGRNLQLAKLLTPGIAFTAAELSDESAVAQLVKGHDVIIHCGGLSSLWAPDRHFQTANIDATANLLASAQNERIKKFVFISTPSLYFDYTNRLNIKESDYLAKTPVNSYVMSKIACEGLVNKAQNAGLQTTILRPRAIFGANDRSLMPRLLRLAQKGWLPLIDNGRSFVDLTYVDNVANAISLTLKNLPASNGKTYNITNGEPISVFDLFHKIIDQFKLDARCISVPYQVAMAAASLMEGLSSVTPGWPEPLLTRYTVGVLGRSQTLSIEAARQDLHYEPLVKLDQGIKLTARHFFNHSQTGDSNQMVQAND